MELTEKQLDEIAGEIQTGMFTFVHKQTGKIESHPDPDDPYLEDEHREVWKEQFNKIKADQENYVKIERMGSREAFEVMENFAESIEDPIYKGRFFERLTGRKPFANFNHLVHNSPYRQDLFDFRDKAQREYIKNEFERKMKYGEEDDDENLW